MQCKIIMSKSNDIQKAGKQYDHFILFDKATVELHCTDLSILHCELAAARVTYISAKGIKNSVSGAQVAKIPELKQKIQKCLGKINRYGRDHLYYSFEDNAVTQTTSQMELNQENQSSNLFLSYKIIEFRWANVEVQENKYSYQVKSDCGYAEAWLRKDLYIFEIRYPQLIEVKNSYAQKKPNMTKILLQKYNHSYQQYPALGSESEKASYRYVWQQKMFSIFEVPPAWQYPLQQIWTCLIYHSIIPHQFKYIEYQQPSQTTAMPQIKVVLDSSVEEQSHNDSISGLPMLGKINHMKECLVIEIGDIVGWLGKDYNVLYDGIGFWQLDSLLNYRKHNQASPESQIHPQAIPYTIRFHSEPERCLLKQLKLFIAYSLENKKIGQLKQELHRPKNHQFDNENTLVKVECMEGVGEFKAYSNGVVVVTFVDRYMLTLNSRRMEAKIIKSTGQVCFVDVAKSDGINYLENRVYIGHAVDFQQRTFYREEWAQKQELMSSIEEVIKDTQVLHKTSQSYLKL